MPTRVVTDGVGVLPGATMLERKAYVENDADDLRTVLMHEPRGHAAMSGALLQPAVHPGADWGVVFIEVSGCLPMCGHGTIGVATVLVEERLVEVTEPETVITLDVPAGLVQARVHVVDGHAKAVTIRNVPSFFVAERDGYDLAFGGNFYAIADAAAHGLTVAPEHARTLIDAGLELMATVYDAVHPTNPEIHGCRHVIWVGADRSAVAIHPGWVDRSPCGTGTSARMAQLHHHGRLALGEEFEHRSIIGSRFTGRLVEETADGLIPEITGRAWITGRGTYVLDPDDPFPAGFRL
jgi:proline racemase